MQIPKRRSEALAQTKKQDDHYHTPAAIERMKNEIKRLTQERPAAIEEMREAATQGDFSENAGYQSAKALVRRINSRIDILTEELKRAIPILASADDGRVHIGSTVTVRCDENEMAITILGSHETNPSKGRVSHLSPLGKALLDRTAGDVVHVATPTGQRAYEIIAIAPSQQ